ncbi:GNAT family N-acetyltransferase [Vreelandella populi]|uniref:GNAT family N-acetyltransferase n=1 Tax=Vreelandella populi TaxID=2498858 RepID=A0A3S0WLD9_9GAMM|nr:GNAT family N-acetyltransferase [Halomonas populi]RUR37928.1 GNAT family N-acetyltransferase [Halomonas populi]RUR48906.1 GNAT family N-acetyltransferase [Halomonas populi]RUR55250.1 GNAT family N-acetyltransferase [Halomonas populi]
MSLDFRWSRFDELNTREFYEIVKARETVFVVEQQCAYQEVDELDPLAWHLTATVEGQLAAYIRVVGPGDKFDEPSIGRVMTLKAFRGHQYGRALMSEAIRFTEQTYPGLGIKIGAQVYLTAFYESFGFKRASEPYDEDGIPHMDMTKPAPHV